MNAQISQLIADVSNGNQDAASQLLPLVYNELRRLASHYLRQERFGHTLQPTALVHEAYIRLIQATDRTWQNRAHFIGVAAHLMRLILIDYARSQHAGKRVPAAQKVPIEESVVFSPERSTELLALDEALTRLAHLSPRQSQVIELRFFGGLNVDDTAEALGISPKTVKRDWTLA